MAEKIPDSSLLLQLAAAKLGISPDELRRQLDAGQSPALLRRAGANEAAVKALDDPKTAEKLLENPQLRRILGID